ncbi:MAG: hypothetical protein ACREL7_16885 [Longimicrobiales bacterium]
MPEPHSRDRPDVRARLAVALTVAATSAALVSLYYRVHPHLQADFDPLWFAARALVAGENPYRVVADLGWEWPLYYPIPALLIVLPFAILPMAIARGVFVAVMTGLLAFLITRRAWWPLLALPSAAFFQSVTYAQWSPLLTAAVLIPVLGGLLVLKPSTGLVLFLTRPSWRAVAGGALLLLISFAIRPSWFWEWRESIRSVTHLPAILRPGGFLLLLALLRWRRPEARLIALLAVIPVRPTYYEALPLLVLVPSSMRHLLILVMGVNVAFLVNSRLPLPPTVDAMDAAAWTTLLAFLYIPSLVLLLLRENRPEPFAIADAGGPPSSAVCS